MFIKFLVIYEAGIWAFTAVNKKEDIHELHYSQHKLGVVVTVASSLVPYGM